MVWTGNPIPVPFLASVPGPDGAAQAGFQYYTVSGTVFPSADRYGRDGSGMADFREGAA